MAAFMELNSATRAKLSQWLTIYVFTYGNHAMKAYWGVEVYPTIIGLGRRCR
jgi:hypothetical protein